MKSCLCFVDHKLQIIDWTQSFIQLIGFENDDILNKPLANILTLSEMLPEKLDVLKSYPDFFLPFTLKKKDSSLIHVCGKLALNERNGNEIYSIQFLNQFQTNQEFYTLVNTAPYPIFHIEKSAIKFTNASGNQLIENIHTTAQLKSKLGEHFNFQSIDHLFEEIEAESLHKFYRFSEGNAPFNNHELIIFPFNADQTPDHTYSLALLVKNDANEISSAGKNVLFELKNSQIELEQQINALNEFLLVSEFNINGETTYVNKLYAHLSGYRENELMGQPFNFLHENKSLVNWNSIIEGNSWRGELTLNHKNSGKYTVYNILLPFFDIHNNISKIYSISFDISPIKSLQKELDQALKKERELGRMKTRFVSIASHQFRTPIAIIQANTELIKLITKQKEVDQNKLMVSIDRIIDEIKTIKDLLNDVLSYEGINSKQELPIKSKLLISRKLYKLIDKFQNIPEYKNRIVFENTGKEFPILADTKMLEYALSNLISNALKYSEDKVLINLTFNQDTLNLKIIDQGIGIPAEDMASLFQPFFRGKNTIKYQGTGLGLSIAKEYIEVNDGKITVQTKLKKGTTFTLSFHSGDSIKE